MGTYQEQAKSYIAQQEHSVRCPLCSYAVVFEKDIPKLVCPNCFSTVYNKTQLGRKEKFKNDLLNRIRKMEENK